MPRACWSHDAVRFPSSQCRMIRLPIIFAVPHGLIRQAASPREGKMSVASSTKALVVSLIGALVSPFVLFFQVVFLLGASMIVYEPSNPVWIEIVFVVIVIFIGAVALALPVTSFLMGKRARRVIATSDLPVAGARQAMASQVISAIVFVLCVGVEIFLVLLSVGVCSLDGC